MWPFTSIATNWEPATFNGVRFDEHRRRRNAEMLHWPYTIPLRMVSMDLMEMDAVSALLELGVTRVFNHNHPPSPDEPEAELSAAVPETRKPYPLPSTSTPKYLEPHNAGPSNREVVKISCDLIVQNRTGESPESPPTPKHVKVETSKRKLNLSKKQPNTETKKKVKVEKSVDDSVETLETQSDDEEDPQIEMMQARVKTLTTEMRDLEAKLKKYQQFDVKKDSDVNPTVKRRSTDSLNENETRYNTSSACSRNRPYRPQTNGSGYCRWESTRDYEVDINGMVRIGDGHAMVPARLLKQLEGTYYTNVVRKLLTAVFSRSVLTTHSLTGKPSPAFPNKPAKKKLDAAKVNDIIMTVCDNCNVEENLVRISITTKCADESKMRRTRENNKKQRRLSKKENDPHQDSSSEESFSE